MQGLRAACRSLGCLDPQCVLCEHNPHRRCNVNFAPKYLVNDVLKAKCEAPIRVEIIDRATGVPLGEDIPDVQLEVSLLSQPHGYCHHASHLIIFAVLKMWRIPCNVKLSMQLAADMQGLFLHLQMCILDGNAYDAKCLEAGTEREEDLDGCSLLLNNKVKAHSRPQHCMPLWAPLTLPWTLPMSAMQCMHLTHLGNMHAAVHHAADVCLL